MPNRGRICLMFMGVVVSFCRIDATRAQTGLTEVHPPQQQADRAGHAKDWHAKAGQAGSLPLILRRMPMNSDKRCVGIAAVTEALLEGEFVLSKSDNRVAELAKDIHASLSTGKQIKFASHLEIEGRPVAINGPKALNTLSRLVADLYKAEHSRITRTQSGTNRITAAERSVLQTEKQLDDILAADRDKTVFVCCFGTRRFPDDSIKMTYHAALISRIPDGSKVVYDPNEPGVPLACKFNEESDGLTIEWICQYRDTGLLTTQRYQIVPRKTFFRIARGVRQDVSK